MSDSYKRRAAAQALAKARLQECASDVMRWKSTGMLPEGSALHAVADIVAIDWDALRQAEAMWLLTASRTHARLTVKSWMKFLESGL